MHRFILCYTICSYFINFIFQLSDTCLHLACEKSHQRSALYIKSCGLKFMRFSQKKLFSWFGFPNLFYHAWTTSYHHLKKMEFSNFPKFDAILIKLIVLKIFS